MTDEYDVRRLRNRELRPPIAWAAIISIICGLVTYGAVSGQNSQRMVELERRSAEQSAESRLQATQIAGHDVKIAVINEKLDTIILQLGNVNQKLERAEQERK
jgi:uncharacterized coiled-coil protein SlyX